MNDRVCMVCKEYNNSINQTVRLWENDKKYIDIEGHVKCTDELHEKIKSVPDLKKKSISKVLEEVGLSLS